MVVLGTTLNCIGVTEEAHAIKEMSRLRLKAKENQDRRAIQLKAIEASGLTPADYAQANGLDVAVIEGAYKRALDERTARRAKRAAIAEEFQASGLSAEQFAPSVFMSPAKLRRTIERAAAQSAAPT